MNLARFFRPTVAAKIWWMYAVAVVILTVLLVALSINTQGASLMADEVRRTVDIDQELRELEADLLRADVGLRNYLLTRSEADLSTYAANIATTRSHVVRLRALVKHTEALAYLERLEPLVDRRLAELDQTVSLARGDQPLEAARSVTMGIERGLMGEIQALLGQTIALEQRLLQERRAQLENEIGDLFMIAALGGALAVIVLTVIAIGTATRLKRPIASLLEGMQAVSAGDLDRKVTVASHDEIGALTTAFNELSARLLASHQAEETTHAELLRSNAELDNFAYVASHDLKAPLRGIRNLATWIAEDLGENPSDEVIENLRLLGSRVDRLDSLLESLLDYSRVGRKEATVETVDTQAMVRDIADYIAPPRGFEIRVADTLPTLETPRAPLETVFRNLIGNAVKHHDQARGSITVTGHDLGNTVEFRIRDDGPGIAGQFQEKIFQMFQTLKPRDHTEGSGMGLAIVKKTIEHMGGSIRVESHPPERGATFVFDWPKQVRAVRLRDPAGGPATP